TRQCPDIVRLDKEVRTGLNLEFEFQAGLFYEAGEFAHPSRFQPEDIVTHPDMVEIILGLEVFQFANHMSRRAGIVPITIDGFSAPVALERAAAGGADVEREITVVVQPDLPVSGDIDEVPGRKGKAVEILYDFAGGSADRVAVPEEGQTGNLHIVFFAFAYGSHNIQQGLFPFAQQDKIRAAFEVFAVVIGRIRTGDDDNSALPTGQLDHAICGVAHIRETHLGEVIETVVVDNEE